VTVVKLGITAIYDEEDDELLTLHDEYVDALLTLHGEQLTHMVMTVTQIVVRPSKLFVIES
jgi:hypothetical protein